MSTFEMVCWGLIALYSIIAMTGCAFLITSGKREHPESDALVAEADEERRRQLSEADAAERQILAGGGF